MFRDILSKICGEEAKKLAPGECEQQVSPQIVD
jgi:hypothetical protein